MSTALRPPMPYSGGKQAIAERIVDLFPPHDHYVEPFAGALSVLLAKPEVRVETVNDINGDLVAFWQVLRDRPEDLERVCALTPHSRAEHLAARHLEDDLDDLERARRVWVQLSQSRGARLAGGEAAKTGWRFVHSTNRSPLSKYLAGYISRIAPAAERLRSVSLECRDALDVIAAYDRPSCLMYVDPPYLLETRREHQYVDEFSSREQHEALLAALTTAQAYVVLSGYDSPLYTEALAGWERIDFAATAMTGAPRVESVWINYERDDVLPLPLEAM